MILAAVNYIVKNTTGSLISIPSLNFSLAANTSIIKSINDDFTVYAKDSEDFLTYINDGDIVINYDGLDLGQTDAYNFITQRQSVLANGVTINNGVFSASTPPLNPQSGYLWYNSANGIGYFWDNIKEKWLSSKQTITLGLNGKADGNYLYLNDVTNNNLSGILLNRNITITGLIIRCGSGDLNKLINLKINDGTISSIYIVNHWYLNNNLNIDLDTGNFFQLYISDTGSHIKDIISTVEYSYRY